MLTKKFVAIIVLMFVLGGIVIFEQIYVDNSMATMQQNIVTLEEYLEQEKLDESKTLAKKIKDTWSEQETIICLFVDYRDIETIAKQAELVEAHLENQDFELARVECGALKLAVNNFSNMVSINWHNIL